MLFAFALTTVAAAPALAQDDFEWDDEDGDEDSKVKLPAGIEVQGGIAAPMMITEDDGAAQVGFGLHFKFGYRWSNAAFFLEQDFDALWDLRQNTSDDVRYLGASYALINEMLPLGDNSRLNFGVGLGCMYGTRGALPRSGAYGAFSLKAEIGYAYAIGNLNFGVAVDYALAVVEKSKRAENMPDGILHFLRPMLTVNYTF